MISSADNSKMIIQFPISQKWIISENLLKSKKNSFVKCGFHDIPNLSKARFEIYLYPSGYDEASRGQMVISPFLAMGSEKNIAAEFLISVESADFTRKLEKTFNKSDWCHQICCTTDELFDPEKKFIADGELIIKIEGILKVEKPIIPMSIDCGDDLGVRLWNESDSQDFTIVVGDKELKVHKFVLAIRSPVFKKMFESNMKEAKENKVVITDFPFEVVEAGIKLCYFRNLTVFLSLENKTLLLQFFDKYNFHGLKDEFETCLINEIDSSNVCTFVNGSLLSNATKLQNKCSDFLMDCLKKATAVCDLDILDKDFAINLFKNAFSVVSKTV